MLRAVWYLYHSRGLYFYHRRPELPGRQITIPISAGGIVVHKNGPVCPGMVTIGARADMHRGEI